MNIDIHQQPPEDIPARRSKYTRCSLFFLALIVCSLLLGAVSIYFATGQDNLLQHASFILFLISGAAFYFCAEKLLGLRRLSPKQQKTLLLLLAENREAAEYCRKVATQNRYPVLKEYEAIVELVEKEKEEKNHDQ